MGLLSSIASIAAPIAGTFLGGPVGGALGGALGGLLGGSSSKQSGTATTTQQQQIDPRIGNIVFGDGSASNPGLLSQYQSYLNKPEDSSLASYGQGNLDYLKNAGVGNLNTATNAGNALIGGNMAPSVGAASTSAAQGSANLSNAASTNAASTSIPSYVFGNNVQAPGQNSIDLTGSYNNLLSGGNTDALNKSLGAAVDATNAGYDTNLTNLTNTLQRSVLPGIRSNALAAGQYGSSRQGIAEGNAISDYTNQLNNANTQLAATNSANTTAQAASAYQQGQDRALAATQGLGAQQYGVASQNANTANQAEQTNVQNQFNAMNTNAAFNQQSMLANAGYQQQTNLANQAASNTSGLANQAASNTANLANAGYSQQSGLANQASQLQTNGQNNSSLLSGAGLLSGLSNQAYGVGTAQNNYGLTQAQAVNGLLTPYLGANSSSTTSQPLYTNPVGNALGGGLLGGLIGGNTSKSNNALSNLFDNNTGGSFLSNLVGWGGSNASL